MSRITLSGNASGTGNFTLASPNSNTDRTLTLPDLTGVVLTNTQFTNDASVSSSGYQKLPSGLIIQWGAGTSASSVGAVSYTSSVTFPIAFPTAVLVLTGSIINVDNPALNYVATFFSYNITTTGFTAGVRKLTADGSFNSRYIAIGH